MTRLAFIGLGIMGRLMAVNLVKAGFEVVGFNRSPGRTDALVAAGGRAAGSIREAVAGAAVVVTMVSDSAAVESVLTGAEGVFASAAPGTVLIDFSSISPDVARRLAAVADSRGMPMVDAPVSGGEQGAREASLSVMAGGSAQAFEAAGPVLNAVGRTVVHVGPAGSGQLVKAANQLIVAGTIELVAEALVLLDAHAVDLPTAVTVLRGGLAGNAVLETYADKMLARDFTPGGRLSLHHKDLGIVQAAARQVGVVLPLGSLVSELVASLVAQGYGERDHTCLLALVEQLSGRSTGRGGSTTGPPSMTVDPTTGPR